MQLLELSADAELDRVDIVTANAQFAGQSAFALRASGNVQLTVRDASIVAGHALGQVPPGSGGIAGVGGTAGTAGSYLGTEGTGGTSPCSAPGGNGGSGAGQRGPSGLSGTDGAAGQGILFLDGYHLYPGGDGTSATSRGAESAARWP